jgi:hypothetical protein
VDNGNKDYNLKFGMNLSLFKYLSNQNVGVGSLLPSSAIAAAFFVVLVIVIVFVQLIIGILNICCCNRKANPNEKQASFCMKLMVVFTFLYTVTFIMVLIYVGLLLRNVTEIFCQFSLIPHKMINGYNGKSVKFLGLTPLEETLVSLSSNLNKFALVGNNIKSITNLALGTKGQNLIDSAEDIKKDVTGATTLDAQSTSSMSQPQIYS